MKRLFLFLFSCVAVVGQITNVNIGATANDKSGDTLRTAFSKVNTNVNWLAGQLGAVTNSPNFATNATVAGADVATKVANVAALLALSPKQDGQLVQTLGYYAAGDGGGATYRFVYGSSASTNLGAVFSVTGGRFVWIGGPNINVRMFGAKGDNSSNDGPSIQAAIDYAVANQVADVFFPEGTFVTSQTIQHYAPCNLVGVGTVYTAQDSRVVTNSNYGAAGLSAIKLANSANVPLINVNATNRSAQVTGSTTDDGVTNVTKRIHGGIIRGLVLDGNGANQSRFDCDIIRALYVWQYSIDNCAFVNPSGYMVWVRECNVVSIRKSNGLGTSAWDRSKGILFFSVADSKIVDCDIGGTIGPILQISGAGGWQNIIQGDLLFNSITYRKTVTGVSGNTVTFSSSHAYETGSPIEFIAESGGSIPSGLTVGRPYWAIRVSSTQVQVAASYEDALAGNAISISAGSGTYYGWHGYSSGLDLTWNASRNSVTGNRFDQHQQNGVSLYAASYNAIVGNLCNLNQFNTQSGAASSESAAGIAILGGCTGNVIGLNDVSNWTSTYPQDYGVLETGSNTSNVISQNSSAGNTVAKYSFNSASTRLLDWSDATSASIAKTGPFNNAGNYSISIGSSAITTVSSTGLAVTGDVSSSTLNVGTTSSGTVANFTGGAAGVSVAKFIRSGNPTIGVRSSSGFLLFDETNVRALLGLTWTGSGVAITGGSIAETSPATVTFRGQVASGSNVAGSSLSVQSGNGTGNASTTGATITLATPDAVASGTSSQTMVARASFGSFGINLGPSNDGTNVKRIKHGTATLTAGSVTVSDSSITASTRIFLTSQSDGGTPGWLRVSSRSTGSSFTVTSSSILDTSTVAYLIIEP